MDWYISPDPASAVQFITSSPFEFELPSRFLFTSAPSTITPALALVAVAGRLVSPFLVTSSTTPRSFLLLILKALYLEASWRRWIGPKPPDFRTRRPTAHG